MWYSLELASILLYLLLLLLHIRSSFGGRRRDTESGRKIVFELTIEDFDCRSSYVDYLMFLALVRFSTLVRENVCIAKERH